MAPSARLAMPDTRITEIGASRDGITDEGYPPRAVAAWALSILMFAAVVSLLDRQILTLLVQPVKVDLHISDTRISLLQGLAFAIFYTIMGLPLGHLVDRINRKRLVVGGVLVWSFMTVLCGTVHSFSGLFAARVGVGIGEAVLHPAAYSLISDYFPPSKRGRSYSLFSAAGTFGIALSWVFGGMILHWLGGGGTVTLPFLAPRPSWQAVFIIAGLPGLIVIPLLLTVHEPRRRELSLAATAVAGTYERLGDFLRRSWRAVALVLGANALIALAGYGVIAWMAAAFVRVYAIRLGNAGLLCGLIMFLAALIGAPLGGFLADRFTVRGVLGGKMMLPVITGIIGSAAFCGWWLVNNLQLAVAFGTVAFILQVATTSTAPAALNDLAPNELRGRLSAIYLLATGVAGIGLGPTAVALITDHVFGNDLGVRYAMPLVAAPCLLVAAALSWMGRRLYSNSVRAQKARQMMA